MAGLRLVASYYDRSEAMIAHSVLEAAGLLAFVQGYETIAVQPFREIAMGGYRLMVREDDLPAAAAILTEARRAPLLEGERLSTHSFLIPTFLLFVVLGVWMPLRRHLWRDVGA